MFKRLQVEAGPQDGTLLVTWQPVGRPPAAGPVTGYAVYADGKKVTDVDSPTGDHALIDITKLIGLNPKSVTVSFLLFFSFSLKFFILNIVEVKILYYTYHVSFNALISKVQKSIFGIIPMLYKKILDLRFCSMNHFIILIYFVEFI